MNGYETRKYRKFVDNQYERSGPMKRIFTFLVILAIALSCLASCGGTSVSIGMVRSANDLKTMFLSDIDMNSFKETITYAADGFTYETYYERAQNIYAAYNICETVGDHRLYAYEGSVYTEDENGICAVLLLSGNYSDFVNAYIDGDFPFDGHRLDQKNSKQLDNGTVMVTYTSTLTPQTSAKLTAFGIKGGETILSTYTIEKDDFISAISYEIEDENGIRALANRKFFKSAEKEDLFTSVSSLDATVPVNFIFLGAENNGRSFKVPAGVYVGAYIGENAYEFFRDEACTVPYSYLDEKITEELTIYVKAK